MAQEEQPWVRVGVFGNRVEAEAARGSALSARGVESRLVGDDGGGVGLPLSMEHQGMEVHVAENDLASARQVLGLDEEPGAPRSMSGVASALIGTAIVLIAVLIAVGMLG